MKKRRNRSAKRNQSPPRGRISTVWIVLLGTLLLAVVGWWTWKRSAQNHQAGSLALIKQPTFNRDIAPIVFRNCSPCHRPGQSAPFTLLTYADVHKRARQIVDITSQRIMPPWQAAGFGVKYLGERRLSDDEIEIIKRWVEQGSIEGAHSDLPPPPKRNDDWQLGTPDLVLQMSETFTLPAEGRDVYHNFVLPAQVPERKFVAAMEVRVGNKAVHHAGIHLDATPESRLRDANELGPGFAGMELPATVTVPDGHFLSWQPGRDAYKSPAGLPWTLEPNTDLLLQLHLQPTGKPEPVRCEIGFYFTNRPPTNAMLKVLLTSVQLNIPAGEKNFVVEDSYVLPVDVEVLGVKPHVHYLGKDLQASAILSDGSRHMLLHIPNWDFNWQQDYRFATPVKLPRGSRLQMRFAYDNSGSNPHNPNRPPRDVRYGVQTTDEMAELWVQVLAANANDLQRLTYDFSAKAERDAIGFYESLLRDNPRDAKARTSYGRLLVLAGRLPEAEQHLRIALEIAPSDDLPHYYLGVVHRRQNQLSSARTEFEIALRLNSDNYRAHGNLAQIAQAEGNLDAAEQHLRAALKIHPGDALSRETLDEILRARGPRR